MPNDFDGIHGIQIYGKTKHQTGSADWSDIKAVVMTHEGIIPSEVWIKCQKKLAKNRQIRNAVSNKTSWLGGKIICGICGRTMTTIKGRVSGGEVRRYFVCTGKTHFKDCKGTKTTLYAESLEDMVYAEIGKKLETLKGVKCGKRKSLPMELNELKNKLKTAELAERKIADVLTRTEINSALLEILNKKAEKLKADKEELLARIAETENAEPTVDTAPKLLKKWKNASFEEKRGVCGIIVNRIIIDEEGNAEIVWNI